MNLASLYRRHCSFALAITIGTMGGALFTWLGLPLSWMLGAMTACGIATVLRLPIAGSQQARPPMSAIIGTMLGTQFGPDTLTGITQWWPAWAGLVLYLMTAATLCHLYLVKIVRLDPVTGYFSAMPGGLIDMVLLGAERGGNESIIALMHSARIFLVVLCLPPLLTLSTNMDSGGQTPGAIYRPFSDLNLMDIVWFLGTMAGGGVFGRIARLPAPFLIGPMLLSAAMHWLGITTFIVPTAIIAMAQVVLGTTVGCRFSGVAPRKILWIFMASSGSTAILLGVSLIFSFLLQYTIDIPMAGIFLAFSPGGLAEMSLAALALSIDVSFVVTCHISRIMLVILGATFIKQMKQSNT
ncbi:AbrB family transcriptional regulator [Billgrantia pellis]|uniref:AbrB family transcriptional regulator n=1 Tax=Billgrantia pellis TaxID=2606936 RepID=A0A7V7FZ82_9GAMM|nr:AbrB family transcriptional regulator [Halomonas pellis]KAA0012003.1 AbrB family transcriptional regulator [Halomonas pellis]